MGEGRVRQRAGLPPGVSFHDLPAHDHDPVARLQLMDRQGVDEAILFPNFGLFWVRTLEDQAEAQLANMEAWNRWVIEEIGPAGGGRLHPVGHVSLRDPAWLEAQLASLAAAGVSAAMVPIGPVDGRCFSSLELDACWSAFEHHGIAVVFHVADGPRPFDDAWYDGDINPVEPMLMSTFISTTPMLALTDLAVGGVFGAPSAAQGGPGRIHLIVVGAIPLSHRRLLQVPRRVQRSASRPSRADTERVHPTPGAGGDLRFRTPSSPVVSVRRPFHVRQRLPTRGGPGASPGGLRGVGGTCSVTAIPRALSRTTRPGCSAVEHSARSGGTRTPKPL